MPRYKLTLEYAGTRYSGWQIQKNARTIQGELNQAATAVAGPGKVETYGAGRTDAGVHALGQVAHLDLGTEVAPATLLAGINAKLPRDINLLTVERMPPRFHARHSAVARSYVYQIAVRRAAVAKSLVWSVNDDLDINSMREAATRLVGLSDFRAFTDDDPGEKSTRVLVDRVLVEKHGGLVLIRVVGSHFLWKMVRRIVGVLVEIGRGTLPAEELSRLLASDSELPAQLTAPPSGLFLERVFYEPVKDDWPLEPVLQLG